MIDLRNIAQQLRLPADQLRTAADLLEQGYQPAFIARYRADEAGNFPGSVLWSLKFAIEREHQLATARKEALAHLGEGVELDDEGRERIERARTIVDIDVALRCFRARRAARQSGERSGQASQLLEKLIAANAPVSDMPAWIAEQLAIESSQSDAVLQQCSRLIGTLLSGETRLMERMRQTIQKRASVRVEAQSETPTKGTKAEKDKGESAAGADAGQSASATAGEGAPGAEAQTEHLDPDAAADAWGHHEDDLVGDHAEEHHAEENQAEEHQAEEHQAEEHQAEEHEEASGSSTAQLTGDAAADPTATSVPAEATAESAGAETSGTETSGMEASGAEASGAGAGAGSAESPSPGVGEPPISLTFDSSGKKSRENKLSSGRRKDKTAATAKSLAKLTPRQRRRRWLTSVLQPFKSLKKPLNRLTAYQMLMLGRGQRSQLIKVELEYDRRALVNMARDVFVSDSHPLARWFTEACEQALTSGLLAKVETDALAEEDELAQQKLLEAAADQLRVSLLQRPVKGHRILVVDTVGPNSSCIAVIDARGKCLATQEVVCSSQPSVVSQNVIMLGELVHKHKVTLVALSNGPARRFLVHTVAELMKQSANGNLRWTMVDRGGAEAYATSRHASVELPQLNRRFRAAVWLGRRLQDPLTELLKLDPSRLRLGSYQRELPQDPLKRLVTSTLSDCLCVKGVDARYASEQQFSYVPGVSTEVAQRLAELAAKREFTSRQELTTQIENWPETGQRQALGFLRIYNSPETLDGTLIHPDDYRLAHRLIENSDLAQPAPAPEGWQPPKIKQPKPPRGVAAAAATAGALTGLDPVAPPSEAAPSVPGSESTTETTASLEAASGVGAEQPAGSPDPVVRAEAAASPEAASPEATEHEAASSEAPAPTASVASEGAADPQPAGSADATGSDAAGGGEAEQAIAEEPSSAAESAVEITPEYSEDVVAQQDASPQIDVEKLARSWQVGRAKLEWLAECLANPFGDTRDRRPPLPMLHAVPTLADLKPGMSVYAIVVGVAEFGAFVELGPDCGGLIHISRLSARYVEDPHQAVQIGDLIQAWVVSVDIDKKRVALTALSPEQQQRQAEAHRAQEQARGESRGHRGAPQGTGSHAGGGQRGVLQQRGSRSGTGQGPAQGTGGRPGGGGGQRRERGGAPAGGGRGRGGERGGRHEGTSRPVVVKSKKPAKPITEAMQKGQEPLRSFSDLMQFYELQRPEAPAAVAPAAVAPPPPAPVATEPAAAPQPETSQEPQPEATGEQAT